MKNKQILIFGFSILFISTLAIKQVQADEIKTIENVLTDFLLFDIEGDVREASLVQDRDVSSDGRTITYRNLYGEAIMQRKDNTLTANLSTDEEGNVTEFARAELIQGSNGEFIDRLNRYELINGKHRIVLHYAQDKIINYEYDADGNVISQALTFSSGQQTVYNFTYHEDGTRKTETTYTTYENGSTYSSENTRDENGNIISHNSSRLDLDGNPVSVGSSQYIYDENTGKLLSHISESERFDGDNAGFWAHHKTYTYDEQGNETSSTSEKKNREGDTWETIANNSTYSNDGSLLTKVTETLDSNGVVTRSNTLSNTYDENTGELIEISSISVDEDGTDTTITSRQYNDDGELTQINRVSNEFDGDVSTYTTNYTFDETTGLPTGYTTDHNYQIDGVDFSSRSESVYELDAEGVLNRATTTRYDDNEEIELISIDKKVTINGEPHISNQVIASDGTLLSEVTYKDGFLALNLSTEEQINNALSEENPFDDNRFIRTSLQYDPETETTRIYSSITQNDHSIIDAIYGTGYFSGATLDKDGKKTPNIATMNLPTTFVQTNNDGSYKEVTIQGNFVAPSNNLKLETDQWFKSVESSIEALEANNFSASGEYEGYTRTELEYDNNGLLTTSIRKTYEGTEGNEVYTGRKAITNRILNEENGLQSGYTETVYDADDNILSTKIISNIQYDGFGAKLQQDFQLFNAAGELIDSGTE